LSITAARTAKIRQMRLLGRRRPRVKTRAIGRPLSLTERQAVAAWLSHHRPVICPPCRHALRRSIQEMLGELPALPRVPAEVAQWHRMYESGLSVAGVARIVGKSRMVVDWAFKRHGLPTRPPRGVPGDVRKHMDEQQPEQPKPAKPTPQERERQEAINAEMRARTLAAIRYWDQIRAARLAEAA
jgi:hypothetical protein